MSLSDSDLELVETELRTVADATGLWRSIVDSLATAGFAELGPEYLRLSEILRQAHASEVLHGEPDSAEWMALQATGREAVDHLGPLVAAAKILADLPVGEVTAAPSERGRRSPARRSAALTSSPPTRRRRTSSLRLDR